MNRHVLINDGRSCADMAGTKLDAGAIYNLANTIGLSVIEMHRALLAQEDELAQRACSEIAVAANRASVLAAHLERKIAQHRRRQPSVRP